MKIWRSKEKEILMNPLNPYTDLDDLLLMQADEGVRFHHQPYCEVEPF